MTHQEGPLRVFVIDDHPAMRAGLTAVLDGEPGLTAVGTAAGHDPHLEASVRAAAPDVVLLDPHEGDGLRVCRRLKRGAGGPAVLLYAEHATAELVLPAVLAGADGLLAKSAPAAQLCATIRALADGRRMLPAVSLDVRRAAASALEPVDLPVLSMVLDGTTPDEAADTLRVPRAHVARRLDAMLGRLRAGIPAARAPRPRGAGQRTPSLR